MLRFTGQEVPSGFIVPYPRAIHMDATLYSGQAFRWHPIHAQGHEGWIRNRFCRVGKTTTGLTVQAEPGLRPEELTEYFRLDDSHDQFLASVPADPALRAAVEAFPGLRLLRQDPWEMLISFLISQNSNEAKIRKTIESLCKLAGERVEFDGALRHRFPSPSAIADLDERALRSTGMGYRAPYVHGAAVAVAGGDLDPSRLAKMRYEDAHERLLELDGVGPKVADCILLYGCDHLEAFPSDVWVRRFIREHYLRRRNPSHERIRALALERFGPHAGYAQHYLFHYRRVVGRLASNDA